MRAPAIAGLLIALALSGCALPVERPGRSGMTWGRGDNPQEGAKLVLGRDETDDVQLMMICRPRSGQVELTLVGRVGDPAVVELWSGKVFGRYSGVGVQDEETAGAVDIQLKLPVDDPVLARLADTGELRIVLPSRRIVLPNAFAQAHDFLLLCGRPAS